MYKRAHRGAPPSLPLPTSPPRRPGPSLSGATPALRSPGPPSPRPLYGREPDGRRRPNWPRGWPRHGTSASRLLQRARCVYLCPSAASWPRMQYLMRSRRMVACAVSTAAPNSSRRRSVAIPTAASAESMTYRSAKFGGQASVAVCRQWQAPGFWGRSSVP